MDKHVIWHETLVNRQDRNRINKHRSGLVWFTGLSASGKSTIAHHLERELFDRGIRSYVLDGDNVRHGINSNLGFSRDDRRENLRRIAEVSRLFTDAGIVVLAAFISPYREDREFVKEIVGDESFFEIYVKCPVEVCEHRDPKGLYKKARAGIIKNYTGVDAPYEEPDNPDLSIDTVALDVDSSVRKVLEFLESRKFLLLL
jgi:adenylylsulfate kinase